MSGVGPQLNGLPSTSVTCSASGQGARDTMAPLLPHAGPATSHPWSLGPMMLLGVTLEQTPDSLYGWFFEAVAVGEGGAPESPREARHGHGLGAGRVSRGPADARPPEASLPSLIMCGVNSSSVMVVGAVGESGPESGEESLGVLGVRKWGAG